MSGFPPHPPPVPSASAYATPVPYDRPWSGLAIAAFVLSILGFFGFTAVLGIILGIAGILVTRGGQRRGMGLAIAAIPISLITGAISVLFVLTITFVFRAMIELPERLEPVLAAAQVDSAMVDRFRGIASDPLNEALTDQAVRDWAAAVRSKHGALVEFQGPPEPATSDSPGAPAFDLPAKFVNGPATVRFEVAPAGPLSFRLNNVTVGGLSLRGFAGGTPASDPSAGGTPVADEP